MRNLVGAAGLNNHPEFMLALLVKPDPASGCRATNWDLVFMKLNYKGPQIEFGDADNTKYYDSKAQQWVMEEINFEYKRRVNRKVDRIDIREIQNREQ